MRLTLRTMLAYLDDILDPDDASELGQKIEESKFANELVHRIRNSTRRLRLGAPKPDGKGMGLDPNTVAEYLDNTLAADHVPDFERVCLESDVHLAEVASCHQILTLVLGEPADVEHAIRERIYGVGSGELPADHGKSTAEEEVPHLASLLVQDAARKETALTGKTRREAAAPSAAPSFKSIAITIVLACLLALIGLRAIGEFNANHPLWKVVGSSSPQLAEAADPLQESGSVELDTSRERPVEAPVEEPRETANERPPEKAQNDSSVTSPSESVTPTAALPATVVPEEVPEAASDADVDPASFTSEPMAEEPAVPSVMERGSAESLHVGRYISEEQVLAKFDRVDESWRLVAPDTALEAGDDLLVPPSYRPQLLVKSGVKVTFVGGSRVRMERPAEANISRLSLLYGRAVIVPASDAGAAITFSFGERQVTLRLSSMESAAALDVRRYLAPGADPEVVGSQLVVRVYGLSGELAWEESGTHETVAANQLLSALGTAPPETQSHESAPPWVHNGELTPIERRASQSLRDLLGLDRPLVMSLMEQTDADRQRLKEVRALASRALVLFGVYDAVLATFEDRAQRPYWADHFGTLRFAVSQGSEPAALLQQKINLIYGADGSTVFRLIRGYSAEQLAAGAAEELVQLLAHPSMGARVLASLNLEAITEVTHLYLPWKDPSLSQSTIASWERSLREGRIAYVVAPRALPERAAR